MELDPGVIIGLLFAEVLYVRAIRILRRRGRIVSRGQQACWHAGIALQAFGLLGPAGADADHLLTSHMAEHLLIADLAAPLLLAGLRTPVLVFMLPREVLVPLARRHGLRRAFRALRRPLIAVPVYVLSLYGWHFGFAFEAAVRHPLIHALQHLTFVGAAILVWWPALEPKKARIPGELWKVPYILAARFLSMFVGMSFVLIRHPIYAGVYGAGARPHGFTAWPSPITPFRHPVGRLRRECGRRGPSG